MFSSQVSHLLSRVKHKHKEAKLYWRKTVKFYFHYCSNLRGPKQRVDSIHNQWIDRQPGTKDRAKGTLEKQFLRIARSSHCTDIAANFAAVLTELKACGAIVAHCGEQVNYSQMYVVGCDS